MVIIIIIIFVRWMLNMKLYLIWLILFLISLYFLMRIFLNV